MRTFFQNGLIILMMLTFEWQQGTSQSVSSDNLFTLANEIPVPLGNHFDAFYYEFSGLARWHDYILLIPQKPGSNDVPNQLFGVPVTNVNKAIDAGKRNKLGKSDEINNVTIFRFANFFTDIIPASSNDGVEAAVVVADSIYFTIEMNGKNCYVVKGIIDSTSMGITITLQKKYAVLPKPGGEAAYNNAGYESITYLPANKSLVAIFEKNDSKGDPSVWRLNTNLDILEPLKFENTLYFRVTDVGAVADEPYTMLAINHHYNDYNSRKTEYQYYIGKPDDRTALKEATRQMRGIDPRNLSFTRVVTLTALPGKPVQWKEKELISFSSDNWEGILPFRDGVLMVIDGKPLGYPCRLAYFSLKEIPTTNAQ